MVANVSALGCAVLAILDEKLTLTIPGVALNRCTLLVRLSIIHVIIQHDYFLNSVLEDVVVDYATLWWSREK